MAGPPRLVGRGWLAAALVAGLAALAFAVPVHETGCTQTSHYSLVRALAQGTPVIDEFHWDTCDKSWTDGHFYSAKAPGLAFLTLPLYLAADAAGALPEQLRSAIWLLGLLAVALPGAVLLTLMAIAAGTVDRGTALLAAATLAFGTLLLPFSTLVFSHVLAATLGFAAFVALLRERRRPSPLIAGAAGLLAGLGVVAEYPIAVVAAALGLLVLAGPRRLARGAAYAAGAVAGVVPLLAYNTWAWGSPTHLSYRDAVIIQGDTGHDVVGAHDRGFFGIVAPSPHVLMELLVSAKGLLVLSPVVAAAAAGLVLLARTGRRAEALLVGGLAVAFMLWNSGLWTTFGGAFGGDTPGPRYLVPVLPFLALPLAAALRSWPLPTAALGALSVLTHVAATATEPMLKSFDTGTWWSRLATGDVTDSAPVLAGVAAPLLGMAPFFLLVAAAVALAAAPAGLRADRRGAETAGAALAAWAVIASAGQPALDHGGPVATVALGLVLLAAVAAVARVHRRGLPGLLPAVPLLVAAVPALAERLPLLLAVGTVAAAAALVADRAKLGAAARAGPVSG